MKVHRKLAVTITALALGFVPAVALASGPGSHGSHASSNAKKYGKFCPTETKQHVAGQKGTPFSDCVNAMAKLANGSSTNPRSACATESKKHVADQKGTPYSDCVSAAAKLDKSQDAQSGSGSSTSGSGSSTSSS
jgi:hypothetical protein